MAEKQVDNKVAQLQLLQQNMQSILVQKQQFQMQLNEIESAATELKESKQAYKIVGDIIVSSEKETLEKELKEKAETIELRIKNIETQEERLRKKAEELQKEVMEELKAEK